MASIFGEKEGKGRGRGGEGRGEDEGGGGGDTFSDNGEGADRSQRSLAPFMNWVGEAKSEMKSSTGKRVNSDEWIKRVKRKRRRGEPRKEVG